MGYGNRARDSFIERNEHFHILSTLMIPGIVQNLPDSLLVTEIGRFFGANRWLTEALGISLCDAGQLLD